MFYRLLIKLIALINRPLVHRFAYQYTLFFCKLCRLIPIKATLPLAPVKVMGLSFANPVGLAAGFERQGQLLAYSDRLGFGFVEVGTVNIDPDSQPITLIKNLEKARKKQVDHKQKWGINLGSLKESLDNQAIADYNKGMDLFWQHVDYIVINLSRPGSPVRKHVLDTDQVSHFFKEIKQHHHQLMLTHDTYVPVVVKIAVDQNNKTITELLLLIEDHDFDGVILAFENWPESQTILNYIRTLKTKVKLLPIIVVGGIRTVTDAKQALNAGASLIQLYTSLVQYGPLYTRKLISKLK